jgi:protein phosphatase
MNVEVDVARVRLSDGDQVMLCTDGLTGMVGEDVICNYMLRDGLAPEVCQTLVDVALSNGGKDNVTVVLARYRIPAHNEGATSPPPIPSQLP